MAKDRAAGKNNLFGHVMSPDVRQERAKIGQPRLARKVKRTVLDRGNWIEEIQYQLSMVIPTTVFDTRRDFELFFEEAIR